MPSKIQQKFFILQDNATVTSKILAGPFFDKGSAELACKRLAAANVGIAYIVVKTTSGFGTDPAPAVPLEFFEPAPGEPPLDL